VLTYGGTEKKKKYRILERRTGDEAAKKGQYDLFTGNQSLGVVQMEHILVRMVCFFSWNGKEWMEHILSNTDRSRPCTRDEVTSSNLDLSPKQPSNNIKFSSRTYS
jgi:hypothetical protein